MKRLLVATMAAALLQVPVMADEGKAEWGYEGDTGPAKWG